MRWRVALGVLAALLLPLPLMLLLGGVMLPSLRESSPSGLQVSPMLDAEQRARRMTYHRSCEQSSECEPPLGCLFDTHLGSRYCIDSQCVTDEQCPADHVCRGLTTLGDGPRVRRCIPVGVRQEGERCLDLPDDKGGACGPGLLCGGHEGWCARPCEKGQASGCPEGFFCADVAPRPVCLPTCEARGCPRGQSCLRFEDGVSSCAVVYGPPCQQAPCSEGRECLVLDEPRLPGKVWTECVERCGDGRPACSAGRVCDGWHCLPRCDPGGPDACAEGYHCQQHQPDSPWVCRPEREG